MVANAYVLLNIEPAKTEDVVKRLDSIPGAVVREVLGPFDVIIELEKDTAVDITSVVRSKIRSIPGVSATVTCMWMDTALAHEGGGE